MLRSPTGGHRAPTQVGPRPRSPRKPSGAQSWRRFVKYHGQNLDVDTPITRLGFTLTESVGLPGRKGS